VKAEPVLPGVATGVVLRSARPLSFWGGVDPSTGRITDPESEHRGEALAGRVLMLSATRGSSSSSSVLLELVAAGIGPAAIVLGEVDAILGIGIVVGRELGHRGFTVMTGGGPGVMEAANRGAHDVNAPSIGFNITLPHEQKPNAYITPELSFQFHYFAMRKMHLAMRANGLVAFPGGFGTLDELFEILTLQQTGKAERAPVVLFDSEYWRGIINFDRLADEGVISPQDLALFSFADTPEEIWEALLAKGLKVHAPDDGMLDEG